MMESNLLSNSMLPPKQRFDDISIDTQDIICLFPPQRAVLHEKNPEITKLSIAGEERNERCK